MANLIEHLVKLTDHRDRDLLELTLAEALLELLPAQRVVLARVVPHEGAQYWLDMVSLDAGGGGKVTDPLRVDYLTLTRLGDFPQRQRCIETGHRNETAWAAELGPFTTCFPLYANKPQEEAGVLEIHSGASLSESDLAIVDHLRDVYRNMYALLAYSDRDALTGLFNRKSLDDTFYSAVLEELDGHAQDEADAVSAAASGQERRHLVPPNYWLGMIVVDDFALLNDRHGHLIMEEVTLLVARLMTSTFRTHDRLYHFGGAQFAAMFHCPEESLVHDAFERLRTRVEKYSFPQAGRVTVSVGFTRVQAADSPSTALEHTEQAVDYAQKTGGNKVCSHIDLVRRGLFGEVVRTGSVDVF